jgi:transcriptional regulator
MYVPRLFEENRPEVLQELVRAHPLSTLVVLAGTELMANHIPLLLDPAAGPHGTLRGHVARTNPVWRQLGGQVEAIAIFQGPHSYITPAWYASRQTDGKVVPTWNYAVVHAYGRPRAIEDRAWLLENVTQLTRSQEHGYASPWSVGEAPPEYIEQMITGIVGLEMPITRWQGKWKVSQNRNPADRRGVIAGLRAQDTEQARTMADLVQQRAPKD